MLQYEAYKLSCLEARHKRQKFLNITSPTEFNQDELAMLKDISVVRRKEGIALAEEIEIKYRREGKFFDEILKGE